jgi:hypothetical protein
MKKTGAQTTSNKNVPATSSGTGSGSGLSKVWELYHNKEFDRFKDATKNIILEEGEEAMAKEIGVDPSNDVNNPLNYL